MKQKNMCRLWIDLNETVNYISKCRKLIQKEYRQETIQENYTRTIQGKLIDKELYKKL